MVGDYIAVICAALGFGSAFCQFLAALVAAGVKTRR